MTKSQATMYSLASLKAASIGPRIVHGTAGIYLTIEELKSVYAAEGFNVGDGRRKTLPNHITTWMWCDKAYADGDLDDDRTAVFFPVPSFDRVKVRILSEKCGGRFIEEITMALPGIAKMHGMAGNAEGVE